MKEKKGAMFVEYFNQPHYFVMLVPKAISTDVMSASVESFNANNTRYNGLNIGNLTLDNDYNILLVTELAGKESAWQYYSEMESNNSLWEQFDKSKIHKFVITKDNFQIFYQSKSIDRYLSFFESNYY